MRERNKFFTPCICTDILHYSLKKQLALSHCFSPKSRPISRLTTYFNIHPRFFNLIKTFCKAKSLPRLFIRRSRLHSSLFIKKSRATSPAFLNLACVIIAYVVRAGITVPTTCFIDFTPLRFSSAIIDICKACATIEDITANLGYACRDNNA